MSVGNCEINGVAEGSIGGWVAHHGGNDLDMERLLLDRKVVIGKETITLHEEDETGKV